MNIKKLVSLFFILLVTNSYANRNHEFSLMLNSQDFGVFPDPRLMNAFEKNCKKEAAPHIKRFVGYEEQLGAKKGSFQAKYHISEDWIQPARSLPGTVLTCFVNFYSFDDQFVFSKIKTKQRTHLKRKEWKTVCGKDEKDLIDSTPVLYTKISHHLKYYVFGTRTCRVKAIQIISYP